MPSLDMSDGLLDPIFQDYFAVIRRQEIISDKGRSTIKPYRFQRVMGVVTAASPNDLERLRDYQFQGSAISIVSKFKFRGVAKEVSVGQVNSANQPQPQFQPDLVFWSDDYYLVVTVEDYGRYGVGFIQTIAVSTTYIDAAPQDGIRVQSFDFSNPANSGLLSLAS